jgi:L-alanine-DL-glutamate epimerase-like enolase superfamily enzyme
VGDKIEVMCELYSLWGTHAAERICRALEDYGIFLVEDPINKMDDARALADLRRRVNIVDGMVQAPTGPGLGMALKPSVKARPDAIIRESKRL